MYFLHFCKNYIWDIESKSALVSHIFFESELIALNSFDELYWLYKIERIHFFQITTE